MGSSPAASAPAVAGPLSQSGRWITDATGRVVVLHGLNQVYKVPPYEPSAAGFGDDDAAFLAANGFNAMRVGVIWAAVEPQPGQYDDGYLDSIADTVHTLAAHGIVSILDFHQDLYNEKFQGEGAPAWAVQDGGLPEPAARLPGQLPRQPGRVAHLGPVLGQRARPGRRRPAGPLRGHVGARRRPVRRRHRTSPATRS